MAVNAAKEDQLGAPPTLKRKRAAYDALRLPVYVDHEPELGFGESGNVGDAVRL